MEEIYFWIFDIHIYSMIAIWSPLSDFFSLKLSVFWLCLFGWLRIRLCRLLRATVVLNCLHRRLFHVLVALLLVHTVLLCFLLWDLHPRLLETSVVILIIQASFPGFRNDVQVLVPNQGYEPTAGVC